MILFRDIGGVQIYCRVILVWKRKLGINILEVLEVAD